MEWKSMKTTVWTLTNKDDLECGEPWKKVTETFLTMHESGERFPAEQKRNCATHANVFKTVRNLSDYF